MVLLVFRFFLCVWPLFLPGSLSLFIQTAAKQLSVLSTKHRKTIIPVVFWQFQLKTISLGVAICQFSMLLYLLNGPPNFEIHFKGVTKGSFCEYNTYHYFLIYEWQNHVWNIYNPSVSVATPIFVMWSKAPRRRPDLVDIFWSQLYRQF